MAYCTWQDVKAFLDTDVYSDGEAGSDPGPVPANPETLQAMIETETLWFENLMRQRGHVKVPIDEDESPDTFEQSKTVIAARVAAGYAQTLSQAEGTVIQQWYYAWLHDKAGNAMADLMLPHAAPEDAEDPRHPKEYLPAAGTIADTNTVPMFGEKHITGGSAPW